MLIAACGDPSGNRGPSPTTAATAAAPAPVAQAPVAQAPVAQAPVAPAPVAQAPAKPPPTFSCCADPTTASALDAYLGAQAALAKDDLPGAKAAISALAGVAVASPLAPVHAAAADAAGATDLSSARKAFTAISAAMIPVARAGGAGSRTVSEAWCPMAEAGWIQEGATIQNPYYGSEMLTCGSFR